VIRFAGYGLVVLAVASGAMGEITMEQVAYGGWDNCLRMSNGTVELIATTDVGPRIIRFGFVGQANEFKENQGDLGQTGGDKWRAYGGHRLWHAPENQPRTYAPDNSRVQSEFVDGALVLTQPVEPTTGIRKQMEIRLSPTGSRVEVTHTLTNENLWDVTLAPWALTVMDAGGVLIIPQEPYGPHPQNLLPVRPVILWAYSNMADPRWTWGEKAVLLRQDPAATSPAKAGFGNRQGWIAYANRGHLFVKRFGYDVSAEYPDMGCNCETFTNKDMLEAETLGPLVTLGTGEGVSHFETWDLFDGVPAIGDEAAAVAEVVSRVQALAD